MVLPLPLLSKGYPTFGSFNNLAKINGDVIRLWAKVVKSVPGAHLLVKNPSLTDLRTRQRYRDAFEAEGIAPERVGLLGHTDLAKDHLALYGQIDIALDTFPYNGTTTTCEALWMGVPVIALNGDYHAGRVSASLLTAAGRSEWIAQNRDHYVAIARELATDKVKLAGIRAELREQISTSPLCDKEGFARKIEAAYREMWRRWCDSGK